MNLQRFSGWVRLLSPFIYRIFGPIYTFKLAMSPAGYWLFKLLSGDRASFEFVTKYNFWMMISSYEYYMSGYFFLGETNPTETRIFRSLISSGDTIIDVGAHIGWYSLNAAQKVKNKGLVVAFEPNPHCVQELKKNLRLNQFQNVRIEQTALANKNGKLNFWLGDDMVGSLIRHNTQNLTRFPVKKIVVKAQKLDSYCLTHKIQNVKLIKVDVEGAEAEVLFGARQTLKRFSPHLIVEVYSSDPRGKKQRRKLIKYLAGLGYRPYVFGMSGLEKLSVSHIPENVINLFFSKKVVTLKT